MLLISRRLGVALREQARQGSLSPHKWKAVWDGEENFIGEIKLQMNGLAEIELLFDNFHGCRVEVRGLCYTIEIECPFSHLDAFRVGNLGKGDPVTAAGRATPSE